VDRVTRGEGGRGGGEGCLCRRNRRRRVDQAVQKGDFIWTSGKMRFVAKAERKGGGVCLLECLIFRKISGRRWGVERHTSRAALNVGS
jgi:hypothetical protein